MTKIKIAVGAALIVLTSSCSKDSDEVVTCYLMYVPEDTVEIQSLTAPDTSIEVTELDEIEMQ